MKAYENPYDTADDAPDDPFALFQSWFDKAGTTEPRDHNAMGLATIGADGLPQNRIVLLKDYDESGFVFYTNTLSRKGQALAANPVAALCFHWKSTGQQIRVEGAVQPVTAEEADKYYNSRPRGSQIGAWASKQSQSLMSQTHLKEAVKDVEDKYEGADVPRPPHWSGYRVVPARIEFWQEGAFRLHTRVIYTREGNGWARDMLYP